MLDGTIENIDEFFERFFARLDELARLEEEEKREVSLSKQS